MSLPAVVLVAGLLVAPAPAVLPDPVVTAIQVTGRPPSAST